MTLWVLFGLCLVVEAICTPWYLKALWPEKCTKSLILKMVCATMFVSIGVLSMFIANNFSTYAIIMLVGLVFGWVGDYFLHAKAPLSNIILQINHITINKIFQYRNSCVLRKLLFFDNLIIDKR